MAKRLKIVLLVTAALLLAGILIFWLWMRSHSTDDHLKLVPKDAAVVLRIDIAQLALKADPAKLMEQPAFKNSRNKWPALLSDPFSSGIDPLENIYGFLAKKDNGLALALVFNVDDDEKLAAFAKNAGFGEAVKSDDHYQVASNTGFCIAWNDEAGIMLYTSGINAVEAAAAYLRQDKNVSITQNDAYNAFAAKKNDLGLFINNKQLALVSGSAGSLSPLGISDGYGEVAVNFENDKIAAVYSNRPEKATVAPVIRTNGQAESQFSAVAPETPVVYAGLALDMNLLLAMLNNDPAMQQNLAMAEMATDLSDKEIKMLFSGDMQIAVTDYRDISQFDPRIQAQKRKMKAADPEMTDDDFALFVPMTYISLGETDDEKFNTIFTGLGMTRMNNAWVIPGIDFIVYASAKNGHLLITNDFYAADSLGVAGTMKGKLPESFSKQTPLLGWVNLEQSQLPASITQPPPASDLSGIFPDALSWLQPFSSLELKGQINHTEMDLLVKPGEGNSLFRLLSAYASLAR